MKSCLMMNAKPTHHKKIIIGCYQQIESHIKLIIESANSFNPEILVGELKALIPDFKSNNSLFERLDNKEEIIKD